MGDPPGALGVALTSTKLGRVGDFPHGARALRRRALLLRELTRLARGLAGAGGKIGTREVLWPGWTRKAHAGCLFEQPHAYAQEEQQHERRFRVGSGPALDGARSAAQVDGRNAVTHFVAKRSVVQVRAAQPKPAARRHPDVVGSEPPAPTKSGGDHVVGRDFARMEAPAAASAACVNTLALTVSFGPPGLCAGSLSREPESSIHLVASYASTFGPVDCNRSRSLRTCLTALVSCAL